MCDLVINENHDETQVVSDKINRIFIMLFPIVEFMLVMSAIKRVVMANNCCKNDKQASFILLHNFKFIPFVLSEFVLQGICPTGNMSYSEFVPQKICPTENLSHR